MVSISEATLEQSRSNTKGQKMKSSVSRPKAFSRLEAAFEQRSDSHHKNASEVRLEDAVEFGGGFDDDTERLVAICNNIIKNKGTFKP